MNKSKFTLPIIWMLVVFLSWGCSSRKPFEKVSTTPPQETKLPTAQPEIKQETDVKKTKISKEDQSEEWMDEEYEGQLSVDVYQTANEIIIKSTIAGVKPEDIDISIQNDMITIRGQRQKEEEVKEENYFYQECYWGGFSRSIILPVEVRADKINATLRDGVLTVMLPKVKKSKSITVTVKKGD